MEKDKTRVLTFRRNEIRITTEKGEEGRECWWNLRDLCKSLRIDLMRQKREEKSIDSLRKELGLKETEIKKENKVPGKEEIVINLTGLEKLIDYCEKQVGTPANFYQWMIEKAFPSIWEEVEAEETARVTTAKQDSRENSNGEKIAA